MKYRILSLIAFLSFFFTHLFAQQTLNSSDIKQNIDKLSALGTVLYFAAHPDDENTRLIAWLANERLYRTAYLSLTRGDGGQNLLGTQQGIELGLIRTQELLAARNIDKGEQYFSAAYDFGFSKTHEETFSFWNKQETLREAVYLIRKLQPDVIINRFPPDSRGGHGHHQASAMLAHEAFRAAADPKQFPEQLNELKPWQAKRLLWNTANFGGMNNTSEDQLKIEIGGFNPLIGYSYGELAALSRSQHKSQGFGSAKNRGKAIEYFEFVDGDPAKTDLFDGINTTWQRLGNSTLIQQIQQQVLDLQQQYQINKPDLSIPGLQKLEELILQLPASVWKEQKLKEVHQLILTCAGINIEAISLQTDLVVNQPFSLSHELIYRAPKIEVKLISIDGKASNKTLSFNETLKVNGEKTIATWSQPYWLEKEHSLGKFNVEPKDFGFPENQNKPSVRYDLSINGKPITWVQEIAFKRVDPVDGEVLEPVSVSPVFTGSLTNSNLLLQNDEEKEVQIRIKNHSNKSQKANLTFQQSDGLVLTPGQTNLEIPAGEEVVQTIRVSNPKNTASSRIQAQINGQTLAGYSQIHYAHIPTITWFPPLTLQVKKLDLINPVKRVAYLPGAGDLIPASLSNIGILVEQVDPNSITAAALKPYDAVVVGVRAYNVSPSMNRWLPQLLQYAEEGGTVLIQYNVSGRMATDKLGPYPFEIGRSRVTDEEAKVKFLLPNDPSLNYPNKITELDFVGWVQERGLYFTEKTDTKYRKPLAFADKNEDLHPGSLLIANYGKGKFVYTSLAFFRQLPAGVPGAYRLFVNLLAKEEK